MISAFENKVDPTFDQDPYEFLCSSCEAILAIARSINPKPHYQPKSFSSRADNGRGLMLF